MACITIKNVTKAFGDNVVLENFNEAILDGEFVTLLGPSGCGKTTMLRIIAGFEKPTQGEVYIGDALVSSPDTFLPPEKRDIGMVFQSYAVWPHMTVFENVAYPLKIKKHPKAEIAKRVEEVLDIVHLTQYKHRLPNQLSGGQQQRVALARALVANPQLLLLDEPLSNLDAKLRESMRFEIKEIQTRLNITVAYVTHDQSEAMAMSDRIIVINKGVVQQVGTPEEIYNDPVNPFVADFVGKVDFIKGISQDGEISLDTIGQSLPYLGELKGDVIVAIRPEAIAFDPAGQLHGVLKSRYFLGDVYECRVALGNMALRIMADALSCPDIPIGETVSLNIRKFMVFQYTGEDDLAIRT